MHLPVFLKNCKLKIEEFYRGVEGRSNAAFFFYRRVIKKTNQIKCNEEWGMILFSRLWVVILNFQFIIQLRFSG
jgi:hypothetical protein